MKTILRVILVVLLAVALAAAYLWWQERQRGTVAPPLAEAPPAPGELPLPSEPAGPRYPIPALSAPQATEESPLPSTDEEAAQAIPAPDTEPPAELLPPLNESTTVMTQLVSGMVGEQVLTALFNSDEFIRRFVVTVDNLPNRKLPRQNLLFKRVPGQFLVAGEGEQRTISPDNAARYAPYVQLATRIETQRLVNLYVRFYPLFQEAYAELGKPDAYFNDRVVAVIDELLATPTVAEPIPLVQPKVFYEYADPELEALTAGQKALLRMGSANAAQLKARLRALRQALTSEVLPEVDAAQDAMPQDAVPQDTTPPDAPTLRVE